MRDLLRILVFIAALIIAASGAAIGIIGIAMGLVSTEPEMLTFVTLSSSLTVLSLVLGLASAWHAWRAMQGYPSAPFQPKRIWLLVMLFVLALILGQAILSLSLLPALAFPLLHIAAAVLPALIIVALIGRALRGVATWRDMVLQTAAGAFLATPLAFVLEAAAILLIVLATFLGLAWQPWGQDLISKATTYLQDPALLQDPGALAPALLTPAVIAAALALVAGLIPILEEAIKTIGVGMTAYRQPSLPQAVLWGLAAGAGFAVTEGLLNAASGLGAWLPVVLLRVGTTLLHCLTGGLMGLAWYQILARRKWSRALVLYVLSVAVHGLWNGLTITMALLSLAALGGSATSSDQVMTSLGMLSILFILAVLAFGMAGGLVGLTIYVRQRIPAPEPLSEQVTPDPRQAPSPASTFTED